MGENGSHQSGFLECIHLIKSQAVESLAYCFDISICHVQSITEHFCINNGGIGPVQLPFDALV